MSVLISRRRLLEFGLAILPGVLGARVVSDWLASTNSVSAARSEAQLASVSTASAGGTTTAAATDGYRASEHSWAFIADTTRCIGCGACVDACKLENHVPEGPEYNRTWVERHVIATDGTVYVDSPDAGIHGFPPESTAPGAAGVAVRQAFFEPRLCMQCDNPPCVSVCPVSANYKTEDGVVLIDQNRCIGCGYCVVACPYGCRYIVPGGGETPSGNAGVADKCTWCYHRVTKGMQPACVEVCPVGARMFGDLNDPNSPVTALLQQQRTQVLKPNLGTKPRVWYVGLDTEAG